MADALDQLWERACAAPASPDQAVISMACHCLAVGLTEMVASARRDDVRRVAAALGHDPGPATVTGLEHRAAVPGAVAANSFAMHAGLADDAYLLAAHPGLAVIPAALATAEAHPRQIDGATVARAVVAGYEIAGVLAELLVPHAPRRGWRVASLIAPAAAAGAAASVEGADHDRAVSALRIATGSMGGPLEVVSHASDGWRIQPALAAALGTSAQHAAAAGLEGAPGVLEGDNGAFRAFCDVPWPGLPEGTEPRILRTTFKRFGVAGYGQAIFDALQRAEPIEQRITALAVGVPPFAAAYAGQRRSDPAAVASVAGIALQGISAFHPAAEPPPLERVSVVDDDTLEELAARLTVTVADESTISLSGSGTTSDWTRSQVADHCAGRLGEAARPLPDAVRSVVADGSIDDLATLWRGLA